MTGSFFTKPNDRIAYYCQAVYVYQKNDQIPKTSNEEYNPIILEDVVAGTTGIKFLHGVQSIGISNSHSPTSVYDQGRQQQQIVRYGQNEFEIVIERVLDFDNNMFYFTKKNFYTAGDYQQSHILRPHNFGSKGSPDPDYTAQQGNCLRNFDITILYGPERFSKLGGAVNRPPQGTLYYDGNSSDTITPHYDGDRPRGADPESYKIYTYEDMGKPAGPSDNTDDTKVISITYRNCVITSISYDIDIDGGVRETTTLTSKLLVHNDKYNDITDYPPPKEFFETRDDGAGNTETKYAIANLDGDITSFVWSTSSPAGGIPVKNDGNESIMVRRHHFDFLLNSSDSLLPLEVRNLFDHSEVNPAIGAVIDNKYLDRNKEFALTSINIELSFDYTELTNVGQWAGSFKNRERLVNNQKYLNLPIGISCSFTGRVRQGMPYANFLTQGQNFLNNQDNIYSKSLGGGTESSQTNPDTVPDSMQADREIMLVAKSRDLNSGETTERFFAWDLGKRNYLVDISYSGGDTSGSDVEATLTYTNNFNDAILVKGDVGTDGPHNISTPTDIY